MSSIRLYILATLDELGPMHGHAMRQLGEQEHIDEWADFTPGGLYGAIKRLAAEGLIEATRTEREGNYPERQVYAITEAGRESLQRIRSEALQRISFRPDPFDLAMSRLDVATLPELPDLLRARLDALRAEHERRVLQRTRILQYLTRTEDFVVGHAIARLEAEVAWHERLLDALPELIADERRRKDPS